MPLITFLRKARRLVLCFDFTTNLVLWKCEFFRCTKGTKCFIHSKLQRFKKHFNNMLIGKKFYKFSCKKIISSTVVKMRHVYRILIWKIKVLHSFGQKYVFKNCGLVQNCNHSKVRRSCSWRHLILKKYYIVLQLLKKLIRFWFMQLSWLFQRDDILYSAKF